LFWPYFLVYAFAAFFLYAFAGDSGYWSYWKPALISFAIGSFLHIAAYRKSAPAQDK